MKLSNRVYNILKWIAQIFLPAAGTFYAALAGLWGLPATEGVIGTIVALDLFLGTLLGLSTIAYQRALPIRSQGFDGTLLRSDTPDKTIYTFALDGEPEEVLADKKEIRLKVRDAVAEDHEEGEHQDV